MSTVSESEPAVRDPHASASLSGAAAPATFSLDVVAPERQLVCRNVHMVTIPGAEGDFGVLPGHAPVVSALRPGVVNVYDGHAITDRIFVSGGVAEVAEDHCIILAEEAMPVAELDTLALEEEKVRAHDTFVDASTDEARALAQSARLVVEAKLDAARKPIG